MAYRREWFHLFGYVICSEPVLTMCSDVRTGEAYKTVPRLDGNFRTIGLYTRADILTALSTMASEMLEPRDVTFRNYTTDQASDYAAGRLGYTDALIDFILNYHRSTNGETGCVVDVGCGPGTATQKLAPHFDLAYGVDPGESMITTATTLGGKTGTGAPILYKLSTAEDIDKVNDITHSSIDMITAATAVCTYLLSQRSSLTVSRLTGSICRGSGQQQPRC